MSASRSIASTLILIWLLPTSGCLYADSGNDDPQHPDPTGLPSSNPPDPGGSGQNGTESLTQSVMLLDDCSASLAEAALPHDTHRPSPPPGWGTRIAGTALDTYSYLVVTCEQAGFNEFERAKFSAVFEAFASFSAPSECLDWTGADLVQILTNSSMSDPELIREVGRMWQFTAWSGTATIEPMTTTAQAALWSTNWRVEGGPDSVSSALSSADSVGGGAFRRALVWWDGVLLHSLVVRLDGASLVNPSPGETRIESPWSAHQEGMVGIDNHPIWVDAHVEIEHFSTPDPMCIDNDPS